MHCIAWVAKEITEHRALVGKDELWYKDVSNERGETEKIANLANGGGTAFFDVDKVKNLKFKDILNQIPKKKRMTRGQLMKQQSLTYKYMNLSQRHKPQLKNVKLI